NMSPSICAPLARWRFPAAAIAPCLTGRWRASPRISRAWRQPSRSAARARSRLSRPKTSLAEDAEQPAPARLLLRLLRWWRRLAVARRRQWTRRLRCCLLLRRRTLLLLRRGWLRQVRLRADDGLIRPLTVGQPDVVDGVLDSMQAGARGIHPAGENPLHLA